MVKVKICGITNYEDALFAAGAGADALGFIFASSPRRIEPAAAREIIRMLPPFIKTVGVFVDEDPERIEAITNCCGLDIVQLHGNESPDICERFMPGVIKAVRIKDRSSVKGLKDYKGKVKGILLDTYSEKAAGGTGKTFSWDLAVDAKGVGIPVILAGGLGPSNILEAVSRVKPYAVDVNSGVEERPGEKSHTLIRELFDKIKAQGSGLKAQGINLKFQI